MTHHIKIILIILIIILAFLQYRLLFADGGILSVHFLQHEIVLQKDKIEKIKQHNLFLINEINLLKNEKTTIENRARIDLGMVKKGEIFYHVINEK